MPATGHDVDDLEDRVRLVAAGVEGFAAAAPVLEQLPDGEVGGHRVLDVQEVSLHLPVGADHRRAAGDRRER